jgi:hypothetical protein
MRLNNDKLRFTINSMLRTRYNSNANGNVGKCLITMIRIPQIFAKTMFESGPAKLTKMRSRFKCLKFRGLIGTGFAHPKGTIWETIVPIIMIVPIGSRCDIGLSVTRP